MLFDSVWSKIDLKSIKHPIEQHRYGSRVSCALFGSFDRLHQTCLARACVLHCRFWSYTFNVAVGSVYDGLFDTCLVWPRNQTRGKFGHETCLIVFRHQTSYV